MKKRLLLLFFFAVQISLFAQVCFPEGTEWTEIRLDTTKYDNWYSKEGDNWIPNFETISYRVQGEYIDKIHGRFNCVYTSGQEWSDSLAFLVRDVQKEGYYGNVEVTLPDYYNEGWTLSPATAYSFNWKVGDTIRFMDLMSANATSIWPPGYFDFGTIEEIKEGNFGGIHSLNYTDVNGTRIIQGIGVTEWKDGECLFGPIKPYYALSSILVGDYSEPRHYRSMLVHFERNGDVLYNAWPDKATGIDKVQATEAHGTYDLQGRKVSGKLPKGIYIEGKKKVLMRLSK